MCGGGGGVQLALLKLSVTYHILQWLTLNLMPCGCGVGVGKVPYYAIMMVWCGCGEGALLCYYDGVVWVWGRCPTMLL